MKAAALTLDVSPLFDAQWTGIPVFTRRLVQALQRDGRLRLSFCAGARSVPAAAVAAALRAGCGAPLHDEVNASPKARRPLRGQPLLNPSVKRHIGLAGREASTVHDLSTLLMPENHVDANVRHHLEHFAAELRSNEAVFCASEATRAALGTVLPAAAGKARVLYQYSDWPADFELIEHNLPAPRVGRYAVVVGTLEPRKNLGLLLQALAHRRLAKSDLTFVVVGKAGWHTEGLLADLAARAGSRVLHTGFVSEFTKYRLLKHAEFLVYPSLYEGFGIPALEAMSLGKPVLAARTSSFPEVIGEAGVYFDPLSVEEFAAAFAEIEHPKRRAALAQQALAQQAQFTWQRMAAPVVEWARG